MIFLAYCLFFFFFNETATTEIYTLSLHDALPILTGTFMDYLVPTATEAPKEIEIAHVVSPSPLTPLGSKGLGESSSMTVPAVIANAVSDALAPLGLRITELPMTPSTLWHMIRDARATT